MGQSQLMCSAQLTDRLIDPRLLFLASKIRMMHSGHVLNPHVESILGRAGFVFNIRLWVAEPTVEIMEEYDQTGNDINTIRKKQVVRGYGLGAMIGQWKWAAKKGKTPKWMARPELKRRLDAIGFDMSLNIFEARFAAKSRQLKAWKLAHNGSNPRSGGKNDDRDSEEKSLYKYRWYTTSGKRNAMLWVPKLKALFDEVEVAHIRQWPQVPGPRPWSRYSPRKLVRKGNACSARHYLA
jgi:hypothetical protein